MRFYETSTNYNGGIEFLAGTGLLENHGLGSFHDVSEEVAYSWAGSNGEEIVSHEGTKPRRGDWEDRCTVGWMERAPCGWTCEWDKELSLEKECKTAEGPVK